MDIYCAVYIYTYSAVYTVHFIVFTIECTVYIIHVMYIRYVASAHIQPYTLIRTHPHTHSRTYAYSYVYTHRRSIYINTHIRTPFHAPLTHTYTCKRSWHVAPWSTYLKLEVTRKNSRRSHVPPRSNVDHGTAM